MDVDVDGQRTSCDAGKGSGVNEDGSQPWRPCVGCLTSASPWTTPPNGLPPKAAEGTDRGDEGASSRSRRLAPHMVRALWDFYDRLGLSWLSDLNNADKHEAVVLARHHLEVTGVEIEDRVGRRPPHHSGGPSAPLIKADGEEVFQCRRQGERLPHWGCARRRRVRGPRSGWT
jgi:hypothetical protein